MDSLQVKTILEDFGGIDGALLFTLGFESGERPSYQSRCWLEFQAYKNSTGSWKRLRIEAVGEVVFSWTEIFWKSYIVLNYPVEVLNWNGKIVIDFDPLTAKPREGAVSLSDYYVGGEEITISEVCDLADPYSNSPPTLQLSE